MSSKQRLHLVQRGDRRAAAAAVGYSLLATLLLAALLGFVYIFVPQETGGGFFEDVSEQQRTAAEYGIHAESP